MKMNKISINKEKNEVLIKFNTKIYCQECIDDATQDFNEICNIEKNKNWLLLKPKKEIDAEKIGYEFYNYVLGLMKN